VYALFKQTFAFELHYLQKFPSKTYPSLQLLIAVADLHDATLLISPAHALHVLGLATESNQYPGEHAVALLA
jgi:hypothetical protein